MKNTARLFKALADETRLRILALLARGELCVCDLMSVLDLPQSTVSRHLAYLRNSGWVEDGQILPGFRDFLQTTTRRATRTG